MNYKLFYYNFIFKQLFEYELPEMYPCYKKTLKYFYFNHES